MFNDEAMDVCENCGFKQNISHMIFDENEETFFCDRDCFDDWAAHNGDIIEDFYYRINCIY